jgi:hypothetical protein
MKFINPFELLEVESLSDQDIDQAKRRKLSEFEVSENGLVRIKDLELKKEEFVDWVDQLSNEKFRQFYWAIRNNKGLNHFLNNGDTWFFLEFSDDGIYHNKEFIDFVSPFFTDQFDKTAFRAFKQNDSSLLKKMIGNPIISSLSNIDQAYKTLRNHLRDISEEFDQMRQEIEFEESSFTEDNPGEVLSYVASHVNINTLNSLPIQLQSTRNEVARNLRNLAVAVFSAFNSSATSKQILEVALKLKIDQRTSDSIQNDYKQILEIDKEREEADQNSDTLLKYAMVISDLQDIIINVERLNSTEIKDRLNQIVVLEDLNAQPSLFNEIRDQIVLAIRNMSIGTALKHKDFRTANDLLNFARQIKLSDGSVAQKIEDAYLELHRLENDGKNYQDKELEKLIHLCTDLNQKLRLDLTNKIDHPKLHRLLNDVLSKDNVQKLAAYDKPELKKKLVNEIITLSTYLEEDYSKSLLRRVKPISKGDPETKSWLERAINKSVDKNSASVTSQPLLKKYEWLIWLIVGSGLSALGLWFVN